MDLTTYQTLTGITADNPTRTTAEIARTQTMLESLLGYTLNTSLVNTNLYNELGKTDSECSCPVDDLDSLLAPDAVVTAYRLFDYNITDKFWHVDPFTKINSVKLVYVKQGASPNGVTVKTFADTDIRSVMSKDSWSKYIEYTPSEYYLCKHDHHIQLAVDAVWQFTTIPTELKYVWCDMITYYANDSADIKSESILTHSYTKGDTTPPEYRARNKSIIAHYAGPRGAGVRTHTL